MTAGVTDRARAVRALLAAWMMAAAGAHAQPPAMPLRANETLQAVHGATDRFRYALDVEDAGPFLLRVEQRGFSAASGSGMCFGLRQLRFQVDQSADEQASR